MGLNRGFTSHTVVNIVLSVKVGWTKCSRNNLLSGTIILFHWPITDFQFLRSLDGTMLLVSLRHRKRHNQITAKNRSYRQEYLALLKCYSFCQSRSHTL